MDGAEAKRRAERLRALHHRGTPLLLPNAWDAASAREVVAAGFEAVATTSGGVAASLGFADHQQAPVDEMMAAIGRIARSVEVPVTADVEAGYGLDAAELADRLVECGAVGCNLEDSDYSGQELLTKTEAQADRIAALRDASLSRGADLVVNARIDVFVRQLGEPEDRVDLALDRAVAYRDAGADCVYPIVASEEELAGFRDRYEGPVNGMAVAGWVRLPRLTAIGIDRISFGSQLQHRATSDLRSTLEVIARSDDGWADHV